VPDYYRRSEVWSEASLARWRALCEPGRTERGSAAPAPAEQAARATQGGS